MVTSLLPLAARMAMPASALVALPTAVEVFASKAGMSVDRMISECLNNEALRTAGMNGHLTVVKYLVENLGLTAEDVLSVLEYNACRATTAHCHPKVAKWLARRFGFTVGGIAASCT